MQNPATTQGPDQRRKTARRAESTTYYNRAKWSARCLTQCWLPERPVPRPTARDVAPSSSTIRRESHNEEHAQGLHPDRASDRRRDHRYSGRDRDPEVRQHQVEGVHRRDEVGPPQPRHGRRVVLLGFGEVCDGYLEGHEVQAVDRCRDADDRDLRWLVARDEHAQPAGELLVRYRRQHDQPARWLGGRRRADL